MAGGTPTLLWQLALRLKGHSSFSPFERAFWARPLREEFPMKRRGCPIAVAYLAYVARKFEQKANLSVLSGPLSVVRSGTSNVERRNQNSPHSFSAPTSR